MEEAERVGLDDLAHVHQFAEQLGRAGNLASDYGVAGLGAGKQMADGADAAGARGDLRHLGEMPAFAELFKTAELHDVEARVVHLARLSRWMVILACPSMRVTGLMVMVLVVMSVVPQIFLSPLRHAAGQQFRQRVPDYVGVRRQPGMERSTFTNSWSGRALAFSTGTTGSLGMQLILVLSVCS